MAPFPAWAHGDELIFGVAWLPLIVAAGAYLLSLISSTWDRRAKLVTAGAVIGASAALTLVDLSCFGVLPGCFEPLTRVDKWPFLMMAVQFTLPYVIWALCARWARRAGRVGPARDGRMDGW